MHHERASFHNLGVHSPDASQFTLFNTAGNVPQVQSFWKRKLASVKYGPGSSYVETSHFLAKAGLVENLGALHDEAEVHLIFLKRSVEDLVWSLSNRMDFANLGFTWLFALDPRYPRNIVDLGPLKRYGMFGLCYWYVMEMWARGAYYRQLVGTDKNIHFHELDLEKIATAEGARQLVARLDPPAAEWEVEVPAKQNESRIWLLGNDQRDVIRRMIDEVRFEPAELADRFIAARRSLG